MPLLDIFSPLKMLIERLDRHRDRRLKEQQIKDDRLYQEQKVSSDRAYNFKKDNIDEYLKIASELQSVRDCCANIYWDAHHKLENIFHGLPANSGWLSGPMAEHDGLHGAYATVLRQLVLMQDPIDWRDIMEHYTHGNEYEEFPMLTLLFNNTQSITDYNLIQAFDFEGIEANYKDLASKISLLLQRIELLQNKESGLFLVPNEFTQDLSKLQLDIKNIKESFDERYHPRPFFAIGVLRYNFALAKRGNILLS